MKDREFKELMYRNEHALRVGIVDIIREQLEDAHLRCCKIDAHYKYRHWEDAVVDDSWEGPVGMSYGFYVKANSFYVWCGFIFFEWATGFEYHNRNDVIVLRFYEKTDIFSHIGLLPEYIPKDQRRYEVIFDEPAQATIMELGFHFTERWREWTKLYKIADYSDSDVLVSEVAEDTTRLAEIPCCIRRYN
jgi:hypothetical protein